MTNPFDPAHNLARFLLVSVRRCLTDQQDTAVVAVDADLAGGAQRLVVGQQIGRFQLYGLIVPLGTQGATIPGRLGGTGCATHYHGGTALQQQGAGQQGECENRLLHGFNLPVAGKVSGR